MKFILINTSCFYLIIYWLCYLFIGPRVLTMDKKAKEKGNVIENNDEDKDEAL